MTQAFVWTTTFDRTLLQRRAAGETWDAIASELGVSRNVVIGRAARLGIPRIRVGSVRVRAEPDAAECDPARAPLPAGHPTTWHAINADTQLAGTPYPLPVFV